VSRYSASVVVRWFRSLGVIFMFFGDCIVSVYHERNVRLCYWVVCCGDCVII